MAFNPWKRNENNTASTRMQNLKHITCGRNALAVLVWVVIFNWCPDNLVHIAFELLCRRQQLRVIRTCGLRQQAAAASDDVWARSWYHSALTCRQARTSSLWAHPWRYILASKVCMSLPAAQEILRALGDTLANGSVHVCGAYEGTRTNDLGQHEVDVRPRECASSICGA